MEILDLGNYSKLLDYFKNANYRFHTFGQGKIDSDYPYVYIRHDIDFCLEHALVLAEKEKEKGVISTYFIQARSPLYNLISNKAKNIIDRLHNLDHDIALHIDLSLYGEDYHANLITEIEFLKEFYPYANQKIVSFHRIGKVAQSLQDLILPGQINHTYEKDFFTNINYFSDSKGQWGIHGNPLFSEAFANKKPMQVLVHPLWWVEIGNSPIEKLNNFVSKYRAQLIQDIEKSAITFSLESIY